MTPFPASTPREIAVIGAGVAGLTAAYLLDRTHRVTLYERNNYLGGHTRTITVDRGPDAGTPVDTGFIVMNDRNYPLFRRLLEHLQVDCQDSEMSFSYACRQPRFYYSGSGINGLLAQRRNLLRPRFHRMVRDILRFCREAPADLESGALEGVVLGDYLAMKGYSHAFMHHHLLPMASAIWSSPVGGMEAFPARALVQFFHNHGLLTLKNRPQWRTVRGGSHTYVQAMMRRFRGEAIPNARIANVERGGGRPTVRFTDGAERAFDAVVLATHADEALRLLHDPSPEEQRLLGGWRYENNRTVLHTDPSVMPPHPRAWASWNFADPGDRQAPVSVSYDMNRLQRLQTRTRFFVTLNRAESIPEEAVLMETTDTHPTYTFRSMATQPELPGLNGKQATWFCGSYFGYGFHEDAVRAGMAVANDFGIAL
jgi:predicted NAD/FAD-binding protein